MPPIYHEKIHFFKVKFYENYVFITLFDLFRGKLIP